MATNDVISKSLKTVNIPLSGEDFSAMIKDLEMGVIIWIIWMGLKCPQRYSYKTAPKGELTHMQRRACEKELRD